MTERGVIAAGLVALLALTGYCIWRYGVSPGPAAAISEAGRGGPTRAQPAESASAARLEARWEDGRLRLSGTVPDAASRTLVISRAISHYDPAKVEDRIAVGKVRTGPAFGRALGAFPPDLQGLRRGAARLVDDRVEVEGVAADAESRRAAARDLAEIAVGDEVIVLTRLSVEAVSAPAGADAPVQAEGGGGRRTIEPVSVTPAVAAAGGREGDASAVTSGMSRPDSEGHVRESARRTDEQSPSAQAPPLTRSSAPNARADRSEQQHTNKTASKLAHAYIESRFDNGVARVVFYQGSARLTRSAADALSRMAARMKAEPALRFDVVGHTDDRGQRASNQRLSLARASAVVRYLVANGVDASRLTGSGRGADQPAAVNDTVAGRWQNRRVDFVPLQA